MTHIELIRKRLEEARDRLGTFGEPIWSQALFALDQVEEELGQSAYYRECRDKWRDQVESLIMRGAS